ncbi:head GIN domain-containing protein [Myxococcus fulvus]|nr:head GIN domain-containing protein [Myxococcus fulvus]
MDMWMRAAVVLLTAGWVTGCDVYERGNGDTVTEARSAQGFEAVAYEGHLDVRVREGATASVEVTLDSNLQDNVRAFVQSDGTLRIETDGNLDPQGPAHVDVTLPRLTGASLSGSGQVRVDGFGGQQSEHVRLRAQGSGRLSYCGAARVLEAHLEGSGELKVCMPESGVAQSVALHLSGSGDLSWSGAADTVRVTSDGSGKTRLAGRAERLDTRLSGSGDLEARALGAVHLDVRLEGSGDVAASVEGGSVKVSLEGSGDVELWGSASLRDIDVDGSGRVTWH